VHCEHFRPHLVAYADGELTPTLAETVEQHLAVCPICRSDVADIRNVSAILGLWQAAPPKVSAAEKILATAVSEEQRRPRAGITRRPTGRPDAAKGELRSTPAEILSTTKLSTAPTRRFVFNLRWLASGVAAAAVVTLMCLWAWHAVVAPERPSGLATVNGFRRTLATAISRQHLAESVTGLGVIAAETYSRPTIDVERAMVLDMVGSILSRLTEDAQKADAAALLNLAAADLAEPALPVESAGCSSYDWPAVVFDALLGSRADAAEIALAAPMEDDTPADGPLKQARDLADKGRLRAAISLLEGATVEARNEPPRAILLADLYLKTGSPQKARRLLLRVEKKTSSTFRAGLLRTMAAAARNASLLKRKWVGAAARLAIERKKMTTAEVLARYQEILSMQIEGLDYSAAVQTLSDMLQLQVAGQQKYPGVPSRYDTLCRYGWCLHQLRRDEPALAAFAEVQAGPDPEMAILAAFEAALIQNAANDTSLAISTLKDIINRPGTRKYPELLELVVFDLGYMLIQDAGAVEQGIDILRSKEIASFHLRRLADAVIERAMSRQAG